MRKVLIIDDDLDLQELWRVEAAMSKSDFQIVSALNIDHAERVLEDHGQFAAIVFDGRLSGGVITIGLCFRMFGVFRGLMVANSSEDNLNQSLLGAGCTVTTDGAKDRLIEILFAELKA